MTPAGAPFPWRIASIFFVLVPASYGVLALSLDMDANWDLRNYHYYNAYAFLEDRRGFDFLVADVPGFYNPLIDVPFFLAAEAWSARLVGFLLGFVQGLNFLPLFGIAWSIIRLEDARRRAAFAAILAGLGLVGAGALSEVGTTFYDNIVSVGPLVALWIIVADWPTSRGRSVAVAGAIAGLAVGLKLPAGPLVAAVGLAFLVSAETWGRRLECTATFGVGAVVSALVLAGPWNYGLWLDYGNPLFPYLNTVFESPWALLQDYRHSLKPAQSWVDALLFPAFVIADPRIVGEVEFFDLRIPLLYVFVPIGLIATWWSRTGSDAPLVAVGPARHVFATVAIAFGLWLTLFGHYRYAMGVEMLAPIVIVAAIGLLPLPRRLRFGFAALVLAVVAVTVRPGDWGRTAWSDKWVRVAVPPIASPDRTLVLLTGYEPLSFLVPSFPPAVRVLRIHGYFTGPQEPANQFNTVMRAVVAAHTGPMFALFIPNDADTARRNLDAYGLVLDSAACRSVESSIGYMPYGFCPVIRKVGG